MQSSEDAIIQLITALSEKIDVLSEKIDATTNEVRQVARTVADLKVKADAHNEKVDDLTDRVKHIDKSLGEQAVKIDALNEYATKIHKDQADQAIKLYEKVDTLTSHVMKIHMSLADEAVKIDVLTNQDMLTDDEMVPVTAVQSNGLAVRQGEGRQSPEQDEENLVEPNTTSRESRERATRVNMQPYKRSVPVA